MKPLVFLTVRSFVNSIQRSLTSARRLIGLIFVGLYYVFMIMRPMNSAYSRGNELPSNLGIELPPLQVLSAFVFAGFAFLTLLLALSTSVQRLSFRPADVDVLFPTPINPRVVLVFRLIRDYMFTLLFPLIFVIIGWRPTTASFFAIFRNLPDPHSAGYAMRAASLAWILTALAWVAIGYAASLFVNRSDLISDRNRRILTGGGAFLILAMGGYVALRLAQNPGMEGFVALTHDPALRVILFTATAGTTMVMSPLQGLWWPFWVSIFGLLGIAGSAILIAMTQVDWMYDQAAARGFDSLKLRKMQQRGDLTAMAEERARTGKVKARQWRWFSRLRVRGPAAVLWREVIIQMRASPFLVLVFTGMGILFGVMPIFAGDARPSEDGAMFVGMQMMSVFMASMIVGQSGFIEVLRRVDLEKPLPFTPTTICLSEIAAKAMPAILSIFLAAVVCFVLRPLMWAFCLASVVGLPFVAVLFCSVVFLVTVLFPDVDDPTQRGFRGLMILLGLAIVLLPVAVAGLGMTFVARELAAGPIIGAAFGGAVALGMAILVAALGGGLYANFNPSE